MSYALAAYFSIGAVVSFRAYGDANWAYLGVGLKLLTASIIALLWPAMLLAHLWIRYVK